MTIKQVAKRTGLSPYTLRYYEKVCLIPPVKRSESGRRSYSQGDLGWIDFVQCLRNTGMPIRDIRKYMELAQEGDHTNGSRLEILSDHRKRVLQEVQNNLQALEAKISWYRSQDHTSL